ACDLPGIHGVDRGAPRRIRDIPAAVGNPRPGAEQTATDRHGIAVFDGIVDCLRAGHRRPDLRTGRLQVVRSVGQLDLVACRTRDRRYAGIWELGHRLVDARVTGGRDVTNLLVHDIRAGIDVIVPNDPIRKGHFGSKP